ncbi:hypothetical protein ADL26_15540, partial [Thermoactinomyces vulgaris]
MSVPPLNVPGVTVHSSSSLVSTATPMDRSPSAMSSESRAMSGRRIVEGPEARAARMRARAIIDFEPGTRTTASSSASAYGVSQRRFLGAAVAFTPAILEARELRTRRSAHRGWRGRVRL